MLTLLVDQEIGNADRSFDQHFFRTCAPPLFFQLTQNGQTQTVLRTDQAGAVAMRARLRTGFQHAWTQTLAAHLHQAKATDPAHLNARTIRLQLFFHAFFNGNIVASFIHVNEINHDQPCQIAQAQLTRHLFSGLQIGV